MPVSGEPLVMLVHEQKIRIAVRTLLADPGELPDGLYSELIAYRDLLDLHDMKDLQVEDGSRASEFLADLLRGQIRDDVLRAGMRLPAVDVARAYGVTDDDARKALDILTEENLLALNEHAEVYCVVVAKPKSATTSTRSRVATR